ncbi:MAG: hypothetical protein AB1295_05985 [Candidatus Micrarchaeota archaeon]
MDAEMMRGIMLGDAQALTELSDLLSKVTLHQDSIARIWTVLIHGIKHNWDTSQIIERSRQIDFALELGGIPQNAEVLERYGDLALIYGFPHSNEASAATGRTAARVARLSRASQEMDGYLMLATDALLMMLKDGEADCKKFAAAGLAHVQDDEIKARLVAMARQAPSDELRKAAGESVGMMRTLREIGMARSDKEMLITAHYPDPNDPRREMLEQMLDAVIAVLKTNGNGQDEDYAIAVRELSTFAGMPEDVSVAFYGKRDRQMLERMMTHCENALLRALVKAKDEAVWKDAAYGLESMGNERIEAVLERISIREGEPNEIRRRASETLERIRGNGLEILSAMPVDASPPTVPDLKSPPKPPPRKKGDGCKDASDPKQALRVKV